MTKSELVGYIRKCSEKNALKLNILKSALDNVQTVEGKDGTEYISLIMNLSTIKMIIGDEQEVTSVCQLVEEVEEEEGPEPMSEEAYKGLEKMLDHIQQYCEPNCNEDTERKIAKKLDEIYRMMKPKN